MQTQSNKDAIQKIVRDLAFEVPVDELTIGDTTVNLIGGNALCNADGAVLFVEFDAIEDAFTGEPVRVIRGDIRPFVRSQYKIAIEAARDDHADNRRCGHRYI